MSERRDNQDVGSEAATIERVRNSSLVKCSGADNVAGLKRSTETVDSARGILREAPSGVVGERSGRSEGIPEGVLERPEVRMPV